MTTTRHGDFERNDRTCLPPAHGKGITVNARCITAGILLVIFDSFGCDASQRKKLEETGPSGPEPQTMSVVSQERIVALAYDLASSSPKTRDRAARAFGVMSNGTLKKVFARGAPLRLQMLLVPRLNDESAEVCYGAAEVLMAIPELSERCIEAVVELLRLRGDEIRTDLSPMISSWVQLGKPGFPAALLVEKARGEPRVRAAVIDTLKDKDAAMRARGAWVLELLEAQEAEPHLRPLLDDPNTYVRYQAAAALARIEPHALALPRLVSLLEDPDPYVANAASDCICACKADPCRLLVKKYQTSERPRTRKLCIELLAGLDTKHRPWVEETLKAALQDTSDEVRAKALRCLEHWRLRKEGRLDQPVPPESQSRTSQPEK